MPAFLPRAAIAALAAIAFVVGLANLERALANPDEGRYSEISREMAVTGDWVTPRLDGIKYFEKPPLQYWATALAYDTLGASEASSRLYTWAAGFFTLFILGYAALRIAGPQVAAASVLALVASPYFMALGGIVTLDMGLTLWTTATFFALLLAEATATQAREQRLWMLVAWASMALAVLSKGLIGIVFAGAAVFFVMVFTRSFSVLGRMQWGWGMALFMAIAAPWFIVVSHANAEFAHFFFVHEHFERFLTHEHRRVQPAWFFVPILLAGFLPWIVALLGAAWLAWRDRALPAGRFALVALAWSAFIFAFFSASGSKLPTYILPLFPALAFVLGRYLAIAPCRTLAYSAWLFAALAMAILGAAIFLPDFTHDDWNRELYIDARPAAVAAGVFLLAAAGRAALALRRQARWEAMTVAALGVVLALGALGVAYNALTPRQSGRDIAGAIRPWLASNPRIYSVDYYDQTIPFYLGRTVTLVSYVDEFETGLAAEPGKSIARMAEFPPEWLRPGEALAIMQPRAFAQMKELGLPMQVLHDDPRRVLVRKP